MDKRTTIKFWQVYPGIPDGVDFIESLRAACRLDGDALVHEIEEVKYQLVPKSDANANPMLGDVIRLQNSNLPSRLRAGRRPGQLQLDEGEYLGHHTAFIFDRRHNLLGFEVKPAAAGLVKLTTLIAELARHTRCEALPILMESDINRLAGTKNGVLQFKIADPASLNAVDPELGEMRDDLAFLKDMVDGAYISIAIGVGPRRDGLSPDRLRRLISWLLREREADRGKIRKVRVKQPHEAEPILDFLKAHFSDSDILDLSGDPDRDWPVRERLLRSALAKARRHVRDDDR